MLDWFVILTGVTSIALALNIGANNSAAEMGPAYGAGIRSRREAVALIAVFCIAGALLAGGRVMTTVGKGLINADILALDPKVVFVVVAAALGLIGFANILRVPIATSHAVVGAVVGLGLFYGAVNTHLFTTIVVWWIATPLFALSLSFLIGRFFYPSLLHAFGRLRSEKAVQRVLSWTVTLASCWMAFAAGSNSLAKALGPAVGAGVFQPTTGAILGGAAMALGVFLLGGRMIQIVGKEITSICPLCAAFVQVIAASTVFIASRYGMPVSLAEIVTCSVIGFSCASRGVKGTANNRHVRRMLVLWPAAPITAGAIAFVLIAII